MATRDQLILPTKKPGQIETREEFIVRQANCMIETVIQTMAYNHKWGVREVVDERVRAQIAELLAEYDRDAARST